MSWSRSSKLGLAVLSLLVLLATVGVASAVSVADEQAPEETAAGEEVTVTVELEDLFSQESSWELSGQTELQNAQWTVEFRQNGEVSDAREGSGDDLDPIYLEEGVTDADTIVVEITGQTPAVSNASYADQSTILVGEVAQLTDGGNDPTRLSQQRIPHYTSGDPGSKEARAALDQANDAIQSADDGTDTSAAESTFGDAVAAYDSQEFADAISLAEEAESQLQSSSDQSDGSDDGSQSDGGSDDGSSTDGSGNESSSDAGSGDDGSANDSTADGGSADNGSTGDSDSGDDGGFLWILLYGLLGLVILGAVGGGIYWFQQQQQGPSRDPLG